MFSLLATKSSIPYGDAGIEATLRKIHKLAVEASHDPQVIGFAHDVVRFVTARDTDAEARALLEAVRQSLRYTHDPTTAELVKDPRVSIREITEKGKFVGDCDDAVALLIALMLVVGIVTEPTVTSRDEGTYSHVFIRYQGRGGWITMDPITQFAPGWTPPDARRVGVFSGGRLRQIDPQALQGQLRGIQATKGGSRSVGVVGRTVYPVWHGARVAMPAAASPQPRLAGLGCDCDEKGNALTKAAKAVEPATTLMWFAVGAVAVWRWVKTGKIPL